MALKNVFKWFFLNNYIFLKILMFWNSLESIFIILFNG